MKTYSELSLLKTFIERYRYLKIGNGVGIDTFGFDRWLNQILYASNEWKRIRRDVIIRDCACDLGIEGFDIRDKIIVHHMNPITKDDVINRNPDILNPEFLITVSFNTHQAIHYGDENLLPINGIIERMPNDTCPWRNM